MAHTKRQIACRKPRSTYGQILAKMEITLLFPNDPAFKIRILSEQTDFPVLKTRTSCTASWQSEPMLARKFARDLWLLIVTVSQGLKHVTMTGFLYGSEGTARQTRSKVLRAFLSNQDIFRRILRWKLSKPCTIV